jgi:hypothetical protein
MNVPEKELFFEGLGGLGLGKLTVLLCRQNLLEERKALLKSAISFIVISHNYG